jgi:hypothetical protein
MQLYMQLMQEFPMRLESLARLRGQQVGVRTFVVPILVLLPNAPRQLAEVEIALEEPDVFSVRLGPALLLAHSDEWWRTLEAQVAGFLAPGDKREAEILVRVVGALGWHRLKLRLLRRLEERAFGLDVRGLPSEGRGTPGMSPRWTELSWSLSDPTPMPPHRVCLATRPGTGG